MVDFDPPIQNLDSIDIVGERVDGGVDLVIVASGPLDGSADTLDRINRKVRGYMAEASSQAFREKFKDAFPGRTKIVVACGFKIDSAAQGLLKALELEARATGVGLQVTGSVV